MVYAAILHLPINRTGYDVARRKTQALIIFLHKLLTVGQAQDAAVAAHSLRYQESRMRFFRMIERRRVKLHKLHILYRRLSAISHRNAVARGNIRIGGRSINRTYAAGGNDRDARKQRIYSLCFRIINIGTITFNVRRLSRHLNAQMMLRDDLYGEMVIHYRDVRRTAHGLNQASLYLIARIVSVM